MTKKDYIIIANKLNKVYVQELIETPAPGEYFVLFELMVSSLIEVMAKDNPKFDAFKFKKVVYK